MCWACLVVCGYSQVVGVDFPKIIQQQSAKSVRYFSWSWYLTEDEVAVKWIVKYISMIIKIGEWAVKWQVKVMIVSWIVLNEKIFVSWRWCGESLGQEDDNLGKIVDQKY